MQHRRQFFVALAAFLTASACEPPRSPIVEAPIERLPLRRLAVDKTIHGDTRFYFEERELAEYACSAWATLSSGRIRLAIVWDYDDAHFIELADRPHLVRLPVALVPQHGAERTPGRVDGNEIRLAPDACPELFPCFAHELGHFAGLEDLGVEGAVMSRRKTGWKFTHADRVECARVGLCEAP